MTEKLTLEEIPEYGVKKGLALGADDVICTTIDENKEQIRFLYNDPIISKFWDTVNARIFLAKDKKVVSTTISNLDTLDATLENLIQLTDVMQENKNYNGIADGRFRYRNTNVDRAIVDADDSVLVDIVDKGINAALENGGKKCTGTLFRTHTKRHLASSSGMNLTDEVASLEFSIRSYKADLESGHGCDNATQLSALDPVKAGTLAGEIANMANDPVAGKPGTYDVVFEPMAFGSIMNRIMNAASAGSVDSGGSFFKDKLGKRVASDGVTIYDDGTSDTGIYTVRFDDEGTPTQKTGLIKDGVLENYLHNASTARKHGVESTGNAGMTSPRPWNGYMETGGWSREEMFEDMKDGLYITNVWYTRFQNSQTGDYSNIPRDAIFVIKDGEIAGNIHSIRVSDNILRVMQNIQAVGKENPQIFWWVVRTPSFTPRVLVKDVNITTSTQ